MPVGNGRTLEIIYDEAFVPAYQLQDLLLFNDGRPVQSPQDWRERRQELIEMLEETVYGKVPEVLYSLATEVLEDWSPAFGEAGKRKQVRMTIATAYGSQSVNLLIYAPAQHAKPVPAFLGLNFFGNQTISTDPAIHETKVSLQKKEEDGTVLLEEKVMERGMFSRGWPIELILQAGFAVATACYNEFDPDYDDGFQNGLHAIFAKPEQQRRTDDWGSVAAWAFGLSRLLNVLMQEPVIDAAHIAAVGTSRLAQTALWAGVCDERFCMVFDNESGAGGSALYQRCFGETIEAINLRFPHWYCGNFQRYNANESALPMDTHGIVALAAPRPLYMGTAEEDLWSDPRGSFEAARAASPVWELLGKPGLPNSTFPETDATDFSGSLGFHCRSGGHGVNEFDWQQFIRFFQQHLEHHE